MPTDPKWRTIARKSGQPLACVIALFSLILTNASANSEDRGTLRNWDNEDAAAALDMEPEQVAAIVEAMQGKVLNGARLTGWQKRQPKREDGSASERKKAWKEREKEKRNASERIGTQGNAPETETETETESKKEHSNECLGKSPVGDAHEADGETSDDHSDGLKPAHVVEEWNKVAVRLAKPSVRDLTPERRQLLKARIAQYDLDDFLTVFGKIERSAFLRGDTGWRGGNFDWVFKKANFQKILEGNYDK